MGGSLGQLPLISITHGRKVQFFKIASYLPAQPWDWVEGSWAGVLEFSTEFAPPGKFSQKSYIFPIRKGSTNAAPKKNSLRRILRKLRLKNTSSKYKNVPVLIAHRSVDAVNNGSQ